MRRRGGGRGETKRKGVEMVAKTGKEGERGRERHRERGRERRGRD